jgi:hypothetical protein
MIGRTRGHGAQGRAFAHPTESAIAGKLGFGHFDLDSGSYLLVHFRFAPFMMSIIQRRGMPRRARSDA